MTPRQRVLIPPEVDADSEGWWVEIGQRRFTLPRCRACGRHFFPPIPACPLCASTDITLEAASGNGTIYSWITVHQAMDDTYGEDTPYTVVLVDLAEGVRMLGRLLDSGAPRPELPVQVTFHEVDGQVLVGFVRRDGR